MAKKIECWQAERLGKVIRQQLNYLGRLQGRMVDIGFTQPDKLLQLVAAAYDAVFALSVELHYLSCAGGVGRPKDGPPERGSASYH